MASGASGASVSKKAKTEHTLQTIGGNATRLADALADGWEPPQRYEELFAETILTNDSVKTAFGVGVRAFAELVGAEVLEMALPYIVAEGSLEDITMLVTEFEVPVGTVSLMKACETGDPEIFDLVVDAFVPGRGGLSAEATLIAYLNDDNMAGANRACAGQEQALPLYAACGAIKMAFAAKRARSVK